MVCQFNLVSFYGSSLPKIVKKKIVMSRRRSQAAVATKQDDFEGFVKLQDISNQLSGTRKSSRKSLNVKEVNNNLETKKRANLMLSDDEDETSSEVRKKAKFSKSPKKGEIKQETEVDDGPMKKTPKKNFK